MQKYFIGNTLHSVRIERKLTQVSLARLSELEQSFISALEANRKEPGAGTIVALCKALGVTPNDLLAGWENGEIDGTDGTTDSPV